MQPQACHEVRLQTSSLTFDCCDVSSCTLLNSYAVIVPSLVICARTRSRHTSLLEREVPGNPICSLFAFLCHNGVLFSSDVKFLGDSDVRFSFGT